jgi:hypothetical protein
MHLQTSKEKIAKIVMAQPEDASYDEIIRELAFERMVDSVLPELMNSVTLHSHRATR